MGRQFEQRDLMNATSRYSHVGGKIKSHRVVEFYFLLFHHVRQDQGREYLRHGSDFEKCVLRRLWTISFGLAVVVEGTSAIGGHNPDDKPSHPVFLFDERLGEPIHPFLPNVRWVGTAAEGNSAEGSGRDN